MSVEGCTIAFEIEKDLNRIIIAFEKRMKKHRSLLECWREPKKKGRLMKSSWEVRHAARFVHCRPHPVVNNIPSVAEKGTPWGTLLLRYCASLPLRMPRLARLGLLNWMTIWLSAQQAHRGRSSPPPTCIITCKATTQQLLTMTICTTML